MRMLAAIVRVTTGTPPTLKAVSVLQSVPSHLSWHLELDWQVIVDPPNLLQDVLCTGPVHVGGSSQADARNSILLGWGIDAALIDHMLEDAIQVGDEVPTFEERRASLWKQLHAIGPYIFVVIHLGRIIDVTLSLAMPDGRSKGHRQLNIEMVLVPKLVDCQHDQTRVNSQDDGAPPPLSPSDPIPSETRCETQSPPTCPSIDASAGDCPARRCVEGTTSRVRLRSA